MAASLARWNINATEDDQTDRSYADLTARSATGRIKPKASRRGRRVRLFAGLAHVVVCERTLTAVDDCRGSRHLAEAVF
jgi:hypothetical protein